jgi:substrate import-associated zinc metallohydrolase lipoprotein
MKKKKILNLLLATLLAGTLGSCSEEKLEGTIFVDATEEPNELDQWLMDNYTNPYNMELRYKWIDKDSYYDFDYTPASYRKSIVVARALKYTWLDVMAEAWGQDFTRDFVPRIIALVGTAKYTSSSSTTATVTNATTLNGMKITINRVNETPDNPTIGWLSDHWLKTMYHETCHALANKKPYPTAFKTLTNRDYLGSEWNNNEFTLEKAYQLGFVSRYARQNDSEDFVETLSIYVTRSRSVGDGSGNLAKDKTATWGSILEKAGPEGAAKIKQKLAIIQTYLKDQWGVDLDALRDVYERHAELLGTIDLSTLN